MLSTSPDNGTLSELGISRVRKAHIVATVLLIEDNPNQRLLYQMELEDEGYDVLIGKDVRKSLDQIGAEQPDMTVLDLGMFGGDGRNILAQIMKCTPNMPVVIHTAYGNLDDDPLVRMADAYVVKSSNPGPLKRAIRRTLSKRSQVTDLVASGE